MLLKFPAAVTATQVFEVTNRSDIPIDIFSSTWGTGTFTLTVDRGNGVYHSVAPSIDPTTPLTGAPFTVSANLTTVLTLGAGKYGVTIGGTPTDPIYVAMTHKNLNRADNIDTYDTVS